MLKVTSSNHQVKQVKKADSLNNSIIIAICAIALIMVSVLFILNSAVSSNDLETYHEVQVLQGDTLWTLAQKHNQSKEDIRSLVYRIRQINDLQTAEIHPGQIILIPTS